MPPPKKLHSQLIGAGLERNVASVILTKSQNQLKWTSFEINLLPKVTCWYREIRDDNPKFGVNSGMEFHYLKGATWLSKKSTRDL